MLSYAWIRGWMSVCRYGQRPSLAGFRRQVVAAMGHDAGERNAQNPLWDAGLAYVPHIRNGNHILPIHLQITHFNRVSAIVVLRTGSKSTIDLLSVNFGKTRHQTAQLFCLQSTYEIQGCVEPLSIVPVSSCDTSARESKPLNLPQERWQSVPRCSAVSLPWS
jgi:hypothetical protein